jgi:hypothetical protein
LGNTTFFLSWRNEIHQRFAGLFRGNSPDEEGGTEPVEGDGKRKSIEELRAEAEQDALEKWAWIGLIYRLCEGDITKTDTVVAKPFMECLIWMSYEKEVLKK